MSMPSELTLLDISSLFPEDSLFVDSNGDGYPDYLDFKLIIPQGMRNSFLWQGVLNLSAKLAFHVMALDLPFICGSFDPNSKTPSLLLTNPGQVSEIRPKIPLAFGEIRRLSETRIALGGKSAKGISKMLEILATQDASKGRLPDNWSVLTLDENNQIRILDHQGTALGNLDLSPKNVELGSCEKMEDHAPPKIDLLHLTGNQGLYDQITHEPRRRLLNIGVVLPEKGIAPNLGKAMADWVVRACLEATEMKLPLAFISEAPSNKSLVLELCPSQKEKPFVKLLPKNSLARPYILAFGAPNDLAKLINQWALLGFSVDGPDSENTWKFKNKLNDFCDLLDDRTYWGAWAKALTTRDKENLPSVPARFYGKIAKACDALEIEKPSKANVLPVLQRKATWLSEQERLNSLLKRIKPGSGEIKGIAFLSKPLEIRKQCESELKKNLREKGYEADIKVLNTYKPCLSWLMEEIYPSLKTVSNLKRARLCFAPFAKPKCMELESRWLEESFPGPDTLALALGKKPDWVEFEKDQELTSAYRFTAWDENNKKVLEKDLTPFLGVTDYFESKKSYPCRSGIRLWQNDRLLFEKDLKSDREKFWSLFTEKWLPQMAAAMQKRLQSQDHKGNPAFWSNVEIEVKIDETDERLNVLDERVCPMEAIHEDIYFGLLAFYKEFAQKQKLDSATQLGRVAPKVLPFTENNKPVVCLKAHPLYWPEKPEIKQENARNFSLSGISLAGQSLEVFPDMESSFSEKFILLANAWGFKLKKDALGLRLILPKPKYKTKIPKGLSVQKPPCQDRRLKLEEVEKWIFDLGKMENLSKWQAGHTSQNRKVFALEAALPCKGKIVSQAKRRLLKPTFLINARHHANEISSTNAALLMAHQLGQDKDGVDILKKINVVMIPLENADGVATLEELLPQAEDHKLHAARYNALGVEYYSDYYEDPPRFPDALAKSRLWSRWLPVLTLDAHGVPSHEWDQPFSGYAPYGFQEFWLPRTMVFAYIPHFEDPQHERHQGARKLGEVLSNAYAQDQEIMRLNKEFSDRYNRYALKWEPDAFPPSSGKPLEILPVLGRVKKTNLAMRCPEITSYEVITEVTDEVANGKLLELCCKAQHKAMKVMIKDLLSRAEKAMTYLYSEGDGTYLTWR